jgi:membrane-associated protein
MVLDYSFHHYEYTLHGIIENMDITAVTELIVEYKYLLMIPAAIIEGPILSMICGVLIRLDTLALLPTFLALAVGDLIGDALWYAAGYRYGNTFFHRFGRFFSITEGNVETVKRIFQKYHVRILLLSKVTMGIGFPGATLFTAGITGISFRTYMFLNTLGQIVWTGMLLSIGYFLGNVYESIGNALGIISTLALMGITLAALIGFGRYVRTRITTSLS